MGKVRMHGVHKGSLPRRGKLGLAIVEYNWRHAGHDAFSLDSMKKDRLPQHIRA
jgi:hypothetical protein